MFPLEFIDDAFPSKIAHFFCFFRVINNEDVVRACKILSDAGFIAELTLTPGQLNQYLKTEDNLSFFNKAGNLNIELHWEMSGCYLPDPIWLNDLGNQMEVINFTGTSITVLSPEYQLLYLSVHGTKHGWDCIEQVCSVTALIQKTPLNWKKIEVEAKKWRCQRLLYLAIGLCQKLFGSLPIPDSISEKIIKDKSLPNLIDQIIGSMFSEFMDDPSVEKINRFSFFHLKIRDQFIDQIQYVIRLIFSPTKQDWYDYPVPAYFSFVHYLLRPYRLFHSKMRRKNA